MKEELVLIEGLIHNIEKRQFSLLTNELSEGQAFVSYVQRDGYMYLTHSEVPSAMRGQGVGKELVERTFEFIIKSNIKAKALCSYIVSIRDRNEYYLKHIG